ncbi:MAG: sulfurtransferase [Syntrophales bacterium]|nr:sulfurtransferase [Syntrophales bacterium]
MKKISLFKAAWVVFFVMVLSQSVSARDLPAIVSADWLEKNINNRNLIILDVRYVEHYREGHIPGAINAFYGAWAFKKGNLSSEVPEVDDLFDLIGEAGITPDAHVVIVGKTNTWQERVHMARVACTLQYAGVEDVAILDGGHDQWARGHKALSTETVHLEPVAFKGKINHSIFVKKDYVQKNLGKILLVDVREPAYYKGERKADFIARAGRLPGAVNLPTSWMFANGGTFKKKEDLAILAAGVVGKDLDREMITYCDTGKCCPTWHFMLKEVLGYKHVYLYDGSIQEWTADPDAPVQLNHNAK